MMFNPSRRNRNIGTAKQGFSQNNKLTISTPYGSYQSFYEKLTTYKKESRIINNHEFVFVVEDTRLNSVHACSINDIVKIISNIPVEDYGELKFIVLRQPKRKEQIISSVWGRLVYLYEFEKEDFPAIILESIDKDSQLIWSKKLSVDERKEFERLKNDGHIFEESNKYFTSKIEPEFARNTQLYRTLLHEFGHYVHYLEQVEKPGHEDEGFDEWEKRNDIHVNLPKEEKEKFANNYADKIKSELIKKGVIPFKPL